MVLSAIPSLSVFTVTARAMTSGFWHGVMVSLGIVAADIIFILVAIFGLALLFELLGGLFEIVQYIGAAYLLFLALTLWRAKVEVHQSRRLEDSSLVASFMAGFLLTLADQKAIFFYLGFFPAFIDLVDISLIDTLIIIAVASVCVGGVKVIYAFLADRASTLFSVRIRRLINRVAAMIMLAVSIALIVKSINH